MLKTLTSRDIDDGKKISALFTTLLQESKIMAIAFLSALRDKESKNTWKLDEAINFEWI